MMTIQKLVILDSETKNFMFVQNSNIFQKESGNTRFCLGYNSLVIYTIVWDLKWHNQAYHKICHVKWKQEPKRQEVDTDHLVDYTPYDKCCEVM